MFLPSRTNKKLTLSMFLAFLLVFILFMLLSLRGSMAAETEILDARDAQRLQLVVGKSVILKVTKPVKRVSVANPAIADFVLVSPHEIYVTGKAAGITNLTLWQNKTVFAVYDLEVAYDISRLKEKLHDILPEERDIRVLATHDSITLSGKVSSAENLSQVLAMSKAFAPEGKIRNLVEVAGVHQVMLEVRVAEMQRSLIRKLGFNFSYLSPSGNFGISRLGGLVGLSDALPAAAPFALEVSETVNALLRFNSKGTQWTWFIDALKQEGLLKILAEPTLIAQSGQNAYFLAGGEFPVPVPQGLGTVAIEYKPFGVGLTFTPTVLSDSRINVKVSPEVSEVDFSNAVQFQGFVVPGLNTRKAETTIELSDGQSFAIAGLLRNTVRDVMDKYPVLGDIPILGALFRSRSFQKNETELVIIVTPHLVKPLDMAKQSLPTDFYNEPNDLEWYLLGMMEGREASANSPVKGQLDGEFGHATPKPN
jgi:pilus assembly protein CpaC